MIPDAWQETALLDLAHYQNGKAFRSSDWKSSGLPLIRIPQMDDPTCVEHFVDPDIVEPRFRVAPGDLLFAWSGSIKVTSWLGPPAALNQHIFNVKPEKGVDGDYLRHLLTRSISMLEDRAHGTTMRHITKRVMSRLRVPVPTVPEQQKIAAILSSVDDAITATRKVIEQTKRVKQGLLQTLMTRGIGHTRFKKTEIGEIPEKWEVAAASDVALGGSAGIAGGPFGSDLTSKDYVTEPGVPVIRGANLNYDRGTFRSEDFVYVSSEKADQLERNLAYSGDLIITQRGSLGQVGLIPDDTDHDRYVVSQSQMRLTPDRDKVRARFLWYYLSSEIVMKWVELHTIATGVPHINLGLLRRLSIPVPSLAEQDAILAQLDNVQESINVGVRQIESMDRVKFGLLQDLLTGRVRVPLD